MNHDVYICYDDKDVMTASAICHVLEENKIKCWFKTRDLGVDHMVDGMMDAIHQSNLVVLIFSNHSKHSNFVNTEIDIAFTAEIPILVFKIDESKLDGGLEFFLNNKHWLDAYPDPEVKFGSLIRDASRLLGKPISKPIVPSQSVAETSQPVEEISQQKVDEPPKDENIQILDKTESDKQIETKKNTVEESKVDGGSSPQKSKMPIIIAAIAIIVIALVGCYFIFNNQEDFSYSVLVLSDSAYMDIPYANATHNSDKNGLFTYVDNDHEINVTSCNSNISKKSAVTEITKLKDSAESGAKKIEEGNAIIYEKDGIYSIFVENKETKDMILIQSKDKNLLLTCYNSIKFHDAVDSLKVEDSKPIVNATQETKTAIKQSDKLSSSSSSSSSSGSSSSKSTPSDRASYNWDSGSSSKSSSSDRASYNWGSSGSSSKSSSSDRASYNW